MKLFSKQLTTALRLYQPLRVFRSLAGFASCALDEFAAEAFLYQVMEALFQGG
jgi:hypothetical protein